MCNATNLYQYFRQRHKNLHDQCMRVDQVPQNNKHKHTSKITWLNWTNIDHSGIWERHPYERSSNAQGNNRSYHLCKTWCLRTPSEKSASKRQTLNKRYQLPSYINVFALPVAIPLDMKSVCWIRTKAGEILQNMKKHESMETFESDYFLSRIHV